VWMSRLLTVRVSVNGQLPPPIGQEPAPGGIVAVTVWLWLFKPRKSYSSLADQFGANAHSIPAPANQPVLLLLFETLIEPPVVTLVMVGLPPPTQPPPPLA